MRTLVCSIALAMVAGLAGAEGISGHYVEVRTCDVYTGPCFANSEMGLTGKEAILTWAITEGSWKGVALDGLKVVAAVRTDETLGDVRTHDGKSEAVIVVDAAADEAQRKALADFATTMGGKLLANVVAVESAPIETSVGECRAGGCAFVKAEGLVEVSTRCLGGKDHICGNEESFYPPLTKVDNPSPAFTEKAMFDGEALGLKWKDVGSRSAFLATFAA